MVLGALGCRGMGEAGWSCVGEEVELQQARPGGELEEALVWESWWGV